MNVPHRHAVPLGALSISMTTAIQLLGDLCERAPLSITTFNNESDDSHLGRIRLKASVDDFVSIDWVREPKVVGGPSSPLASAHAGLGGERVKREPRGGRLPRVHQRQ